MSKRKQHSPEFKAKVAHRRAELWCVTMGMLSSVLSVANATDFVVGHLHFAEVAFLQSRQSLCLCAAEVDRVAPTMDYAVRSANVRVCLGL